MAHGKWLKGRSKRPLVLAAGKGRANLDANQEKRNVSISRSPLTLFAAQQALAKCRLFKGLSAEACEEIAAQSLIQRQPRKIMLINQGDKPHGIYAILKGRVKVFRSSVEGSEIITRLIGPGESLLENVHFYNKPSPVAAQTETDAELLLIPSAVIGGLVRRHPQLGLNIMHILACRTNELMYQLEQVTVHPALERVAGFLLRVMLEEGGPCKEFELPYEKSEVANHLGLTPETFSRCLKLLAERGIKVKGKIVIMEDPRKLCENCDPVYAHNCRHKDSPECPLAGL